MKKQRETTKNKHQTTISFLKTKSRKDEKCIIRHHRVIQCQRILKFHNFSEKVKNCGEESKKRSCWAGLRAVLKAGGLDRALAFRHLGIPIDKSMDTPICNCFGP